MALLCLVGSQAGHESQGICHSRDRKIGGNNSYFGECERYHLRYKLDGSLLIEIAVLNLQLLQLVW